MNKQIFQYKPQVIFIMGPTASGKTALVTELYQRLPIEIISVDSVLVYRGMDIGTAKPTMEELKITPYRLINILDPSERYSVANFCHDALIEIKKVIALGRIPLLIGGSMFYFKALLKGLSVLPSSNIEIRKEIETQARKFGWKEIHKRLQEIDPISAIRIHHNDSQRLSRALEVFLLSGKSITELTKVVNAELPYNVLQFVVLLENRKILYQRIKKRFLQMLDEGFEDEVRRLYGRGNLHKDLPSIRSVGYRQMWSYFSGEINYDEMVYRGICATCQLAKRQMTWLNGWNSLHRLDGNDIPGSIDTILHLIGL